MEELLVAENITQIYGAEDGKSPKVVALQDVSLAVRQGEFLTICGPSGCGKTTILEVLTGLRQPTSGQVLLDGQKVAGPTLDIGIVFQEQSAFPWRTVAENVEFGLEVQHVAKAERRERAREFLRIVGLDEFADVYPHQLSGGMRQRVAIARTLVTHPRVVVMDEPFGALDEQTRMDLGDELLRLVRETNATVVFVTHSIQEAAYLSDRVLVFSARPGMVRSVIDSTLPTHRDAEVLTTSAFAEMTKQIWTAIRSGKAGAPLSIKESA